MGARPNFMKIAPIVEELRRRRIKQFLVHTGQHYDFSMSGSFFKELELPVPDANLGIGSDTHAKQTARIMMEFEDILLREKPDLVMVVGDVNSTLACTLTAVKMHIPIAHVEAGLRSFNRRMPEEINRLLTDQISDYCFVTEDSAIKNLKKEGIPEEKIYFVGNVMIDTLVKHKSRAEYLNVHEKFNMDSKEYCLITLHRPSNVDNKESLIPILEAIERISRDIKTICSIHPRTQKSLERFGLLRRVEKNKDIILVPPQGYLYFLSLMMHSKFILTDSGGIQEEATFLKIPCITLREETERPITTTIGTNRLVGKDKKKIISESLRILKEKKVSSKIPPLWDGKAAKRIVKIILNQIDEKHN